MTSRVGLMSPRSIDAYNSRKRVAAYDADMALMHLNRSKMVEIALEVLPLSLPARAVLWLAVAMACP